MRSYEITFLIDPVLSKEDIVAIPATYVDLLKAAGSKIVHQDNMGLKQLAYPINKRTTAVYHCVEFQTSDSSIIDKLELSMRRDERIMRFLTVKLDKYGVQYNADKRAGKFPRKREEKTENTPADRATAPTQATAAAKKEEE